MRRNAIFIIMTIALVLLLTLPAGAGYEYKVNKEHLGGNLTPVEAYQMVQKDPEHTFLVDCRAQPEYQLVEHPVGAYNIPIRFFFRQGRRKGLPGS